MAAQAKYAPDMAPINLPQGLGIVVSCALYYGLQVLPFHLRGFTLAALRSFGIVRLAFIKQYAADRTKLQRFWETQGCTLHVVLARPGLLPSEDRERYEWKYVFCGASSMCRRSLSQTGVTLSPLLVCLSLALVRSCHHDCLNSPADHLTNAGLVKVIRLPWKSAVSRHVRFSIMPTHARTLSLLLAVGSLLSYSPTVAQTTATVASRLAAQNSLFEEYHQSRMKESPTRATNLGDYRYNDRLADYSLAEVARVQAENDAFMLRLKAIATDGFAEQDRLSHDLLLSVLSDDRAYRDLKSYELPGDAVGNTVGVHVALADLPLSMPLDSVKHYEDYIARLHQIPLAFTQTEDVMRVGIRDNLMPVKFLLEKVPVQCDGIIAADPFLGPIKKLPASFSAEDKARLTKAISDAVNTEVLPAYKAFGQFVAKEYAPHGRTALGINTLPDGARRYQAAIHVMTTTDMTPDAIHTLGLKEIDRIEAEMTAIAKKQGFADLASFRASVKSNPKNHATSSDQILDDYRKYIAQMEPKLPELFTFIPGKPVTVEAIPAFQPAMATHAVGGTPDGSRPGRVVVQTSDPTQRTLVSDEAVAYHEGIPGHVFQDSVAKAQTGLPMFRVAYSNSGYGEGWGLYAEQLGKEVGFYQDPVSDYGRLSSELFRAVRLVVDTGLHSEGWTREQVVAFFRKEDCIDEPLIQAEVDRYIATPAQALSYKLGQLKFRELRARAQAELGPKFDVRTFHDEMLNGGRLPLDLLDARTNRWIAAQKDAKTTVASRDKE